MLNHTSIFLQTILAILNTQPEEMLPETMTTISPNAIDIDIGFDGREIAFENITDQDVEMKKCYDIYGCFSINYPWSSLRRPVTLFPESPEKINPIYCLYTRRNPKECQRLRLGDPSSIFRSNLMANKKTHFITHGYLETAEKPWVKDMSAELLKKADVNVITVDWVGGSSPTYTQAVSNIRLVGIMTAHLVKLLMEEGGVDPRRIHLIGHSLGAHLSGYVGHKIKEFGARIGRITGMDPADPQFDGMDPIVRLDPTDAIFVDVIHTDTRPFVSGGFGLAAPVGHLDIYPNGGEYQPGCNKGMLNYISEEKGHFMKGIRLYVGCNHIRSYQYFTESINSECPFAAVECSSFDEFLTGKCFACQSHGINPEESINFTGGDQKSTNKTWCTRMGYHAVDPYLDSDIPISPSRNLVKMYLITSSVPPFCRHHYRVTIKISSSAKSKAHRGEVGGFWLTLRGEKASYSGRMQLNPRDMYFEPGRTHTWVVAGDPVGRLTSAKIEWVFGMSLFNPLSWRPLTLPSIHLASLTVEVLESGEKMTLCTEGEPLVTKVPRYFTADQSAPCSTSKGSSFSFGIFGERHDEDEESEEDVIIPEKKEEEQAKKEEDKAKKEDDKQKDKKEQGKSFISILFGG